MIGRFLLAALTFSLWALAPMSRACATDAGQSLKAEAAKPMSNACNHFGFNLLGQIAHEDFGENIFISPASAAVALAMLYNGAGGTTREEMAAALEVSGWTLDALNAASASLLQSLDEGDEQVELAVANSIWYRNTFQCRSEFLDRTSKSYAAKIEPLNFDDPSAVGTINNWVKANTREKIESIIDRIDPLDVMFLINAVYFKGMWTHPFTKSQTSDRAFHRLDGTTADVPMMQQERAFEYLEEDAFQAIRLPYGAETFSMYLFLPAAEYELRSFVADLNPENWARWRDAFRSQEVYIVIPRFKLEYDRSFNDALQAMGMKTAFDARLADFSGMREPSDASSPNLYVSFVRQKTYVDVNEEGTEAAAVTGIGVALASMPLPAVAMVVDRPFFCAIVDDSTGLMLFMGVITDPAAT